MPQVGEPGVISSFLQNLFSSDKAHSGPANEAPDEIRVQAPRQTSQLPIGAIKPSGYVKKDDDIYIK